MPRPRSWSDWHKDLDEAFSSHQALFDEASEMLEKSKLSIDAKSSREYDPMLVSTKRQKRLIWYHEEFGVIGLAHCVYLIALEEIDSDEVDDIKSYPKRSKSESESSSYKRQKRADDDDSGGSGGRSSGAIFGHRSWHRIVKDYRLGSQSRTLYMLSAVPQEVMSAILRGNIPQRMQNPEFAEKYRSWLSLSDTQGTYAVFVAANPSRCPDRAGEGIVLAEMLDTIDKMWTYISPELGLESSKLSKDIDNQFDLGKNRDINYRRERKFGSGSDNRNFQAHEYWLHGVERLYKEAADFLKRRGTRQLMDEHLTRCLVYIGASGSCLRRATEHWTLRSGKKTSSLLGLFLSTLKYTYKDKYTASDHTYQILRSTHMDDIGLDEIISSVIHSGYYWDTGLNLTWAGSTYASENAYDKLARNAAFIRESGNQERSLQDSYHKIERANLALKPTASLADEASDIETAIEGQMTAIGKSLQDVETCRALLEREKLRKSFARLGI